MADLEATTAFVGLGSNLGPGPEHFERALAFLDAEPRCRVLACSRVHRSTPMGPPQPTYWNAVARLETTMGPSLLLALLHAVERACGRVRSRRRWGPRILDLDLLAYGTLTVHAPRLHLPHGLDRPFVRGPLSEVSSPAELSW